MATGRGICAILENYQAPEGIKVPQVLQPYLDTDFIPFVNLGGMPKTKGEIGQVKKGKE